MPINRGAAVLIAIIVSLISLLPLAISLALERDKQIKDLSNARQIALALKNLPQITRATFLTKSRVQIMQMRPIL